MHRLVQRSATAARALLLPASTAYSGGGGDGGFAEPAGTTSSKSRTTTATTLQSAATDLGTVPVCSTVVARATFRRDRDKGGESVSYAGHLDAWPVVPRT